MRDSLQNEETISIKGYLLDHEAIKHVETYESIPKNRKSLTAWIDSNPEYWDSQTSVKFFKNFDRKED